MKESIDQFFSTPSFAVVGVSGDRRKFGNVVYRFMKERQLPVYPVNPKLPEVEGNRCYASLSDVPDDVKSVVIVVPPSVSMQVVEEAARRGIKGVWMQPGAESDAAIAAAKRHGMAVVHHQCIMMFLEPVKSFHALHRWVKKLVGSYPG